MKKYPALKAGLNIVDGKVVLHEIADLFKLPYTPVEDVL
jgi:alanine dehydrogenase